MGEVAELVLVPARKRAVPPPRLSNLERKLIEMKSRSVEAAGIVRARVVSEVLSGEVPVLRDQGSVVPVLVILLVNNTLNQTTGLRSNNLLGAVVS